MGPKGVGYYRDRGGSGLIKVICQEGWYFYGLWQNNQSEGSSRHEDCKGILCQSPERQHLKSSGTSDQFWALLFSRRPRSSTTECFRLAAAQDVGISTPFERRGL